MPEIYTVAHIIGNPNCLAIGTEIRCRNGTEDPWLSHVYKYGGCTATCLFLGITHPTEYTLPVDKRWQITININKELR